MKRRDFLIASGLSTFSLTYPPLANACGRRQRGGRTRNDSGGNGDLATYPISRGPVYRTDPTYNIGGHLVKFVYRTGPQLVNTSDINQAIISRGQQNLPSHVWDDRQYFATLDTGSNCNMQIGWYDRTDGNYGWVDVLNTTDYWYSRSSINTRWARMPEPNGWNDGDWTIGGRSVKLYVRNPENSSGFTPNDIVFSYGWFG